MSDQALNRLDKARESLRAARLLLDEGFVDIAASRAYYAMFCTAESLLSERGLSFSKHSAVLAAYGKEFSKTGDLDSRFHTNFIQAQDYRNQGDYGYGPSVTKEQVQEVIGWAEEFIEAAKVYLQTNA